MDVVQILKEESSASSPHNIQPAAIPPAPRGCWAKWHLGLVVVTVDYNLWSSHSVSLLGVMATIFFSSLSVHHFQEEEVSLHKNPFSIHSKEQSKHTLADSSCYYITAMPSFLGWLCSL
jgi:protein-S-isoprenylcysteine O-methyltransferase Ste14